MVKNTFPNIKNELKLNEENLREIKFLSKEKKIIIDIGCGHGDYLIDKTNNDKENLFIGIEISRKRTYKTSERLAKRNIKNYRVINGDGEQILKTFFPDDSIYEANILFPDPWLKKQQWKNRIFKPSFVIQLIRTLKINGKIFFASDIREYALEVYNLLSKFKEIKNSYNNPIEIDIYPNFPTLFFNKMSKERPINYICFEKLHG